MGEKYTKDTKIEFPDYRKGIETRKITLASRNYNKSTVHNMIQKKTEKLWAVVDWDILQKDDKVFCKIFVPHIILFAHAIFNHKEYADKYSKLMNQGTRTIVVPCEVTYTLPITKGKRYKTYQNSLKD